ncbi:obscurin-like [Lethenteron reissneri]|uniref:obscurin-like n=1 Tax=Lethenteron reissneri TaxID=7753 RepID=UPI002AB79FA9|nr:obscurin-like [Lethenteron reissneri]
MVREGRKASLVISSVELGDSDQYTCDSGNFQTTAKLTVTEAGVVFTKSLSDTKVQAEGEVTLSCETSKAGSPVQWYHDDHLLDGSDKRFHVKRDGKAATLKISRVELTDSGKYVCDSGFEKTSATLTVTELPVEFSKELGELSVEEGHKAELTCETSRGDTPVVWLKGDKILKAGAKYRMVREGRKASLVISSVELGDGDQYTCDSGNFKTSANLTVTEAGVVFTKSLSDTKVQAEDEVTLSCETSKAGSPVQWYHEHELLDGSDKRFHVKRDGKSATLKISRVELTDSGKYVCDSGLEKTSATLTVTELPVTFTKELGELSVEEGHEAELTCETCRGDTPVAWRKGDKTLKAGAKYRMVREGRKASLVISSVELGDSDQYTCDSGNFQTTAKFTVREAGVVFTKSLSDTKVQAEDEVTLLCETSKAGSPVQWYHGDQLLDGSDKRFHVKRDGKAATLKISRVELTDSGKYVCDSGFKKTSATLTVTELPVEFSKELGSLSVEEANEAELTCETSRGDTPVVWLKGDKILKTGAKYRMVREGRKASLVISSVELGDSDQYTCDSGNFQTTAKLTVTEAGVVFTKPLSNTKVQAEDEVTLSCETSKAGSPVQWYHEDQLLDGSNKRFHVKRDGKAAMLKISFVELTDSGKYVCDSGFEKTSATLNVTELPVEFSKELGSLSVEEAHEAELTCETSRGDTLVVWLKGDKILKAGAKYRMVREGRKASLVISSVELGDSDQYTCDSGNFQTSAKLTVTESGVVFTKPLSDTQVQAEGEVTLSCETSKAGSPVQWYHEDQLLDGSDKRFYVKRDGKAAVLKISHVELTDSGKYVCDSGFEKTSATLNVTELPIKFSKELGELSVEEAHEAELTCETSRGDTPVVWLKGDKILKAGAKYRMVREGRKASLVISSVELGDSDQYTCDSGNFQTTAKLTVTESGVVFTKYLSDTKVQAEDEVTLSCETSKAGSPVQWYHEDQLLDGGDKRFHVKRDGKAATLKISCVELTDSGMYVCDSGFEKTSATLTVTELPVEFSKELGSLSVEEAHEAELTCETSRGDTSVVWRKGDKILKAGAKYRMVREGRKASLVISSVELGDSDQYMCDSGNFQTSAKLTVTEAGVVFTKPLSNTKVQAEDEVTLSCETSKAGSPVQWYHEDQLLDGSDKRFHVKRDGKAATLKISCVELTDSGKYVCDSGFEKTSATLNVTELPVEFSKELGSLSVEEAHEAELTCETSRGDTPVVWLKGDKILKAGAKYRMVREGRKASLVISSVELGDSDQYTCDSGNFQTSAKLTVTEAGVVFTKPLSNTKVQAEDEVTLSCETSKAGSPVQWYHEDQLLDGSDKRFHVKRDGKAATLKISCVELTDSGKYVCDSGFEKTSATLNVTELPVEFSKELGSLSVEEAHEAELTCETSRGDTPVVWLKGDKILKAGAKYRMVREGRKASLVISSVELGDSDQYTCDSGNFQTSAKLTVTEAGVVFTKPLSNTKVQAEDEVTLSCETSKAGSPVQWYHEDQLLDGSDKRFHVKRDGKAATLKISCVELTDSGIVWLKGDKILKAGAKYRMVREGRKASLVISSVELGDSDQYTCDSGNFQTSAKLTVTVVWLKGDKILKAGAKYRMVREGRKASLVISSVELGDSDQYTCDSGNFQTSAKLTVTVCCLSWIMLASTHRGPYSS